MDAPDVHKQLIITYEDGHIDGPYLIERVITRANGTVEVTASKLRPVVLDFD